MENEKQAPRLDVKSAVSKINNLIFYNTGNFLSVKSNTDTNFYPFYAVTNENLGYFADLDIAGKDALTVTGSGDHALNLAFFGAKSVETFDINHLTFLAFDLKKNAILHLSRKEFIEFYSAPLFRKDLYNKVAPFLKPQTRAVFDVIVSTRGAIRECVSEASFCSEYVVRNNPYMASNETYKEMQTRLKNLKSPIISRRCPVNKLGDMFAPKDVVVLSNILHYCLNNSYDSADYNFNSREKNVGFLKSMSGVLKTGGLVSLLYMFHGNSNDERKLKEILKINARPLEVTNSREKMPKTCRVLVASKEDFPELE